MDLQGRGNCNDTVVVLELEVLLLWFQTVVTQMNVSTYIEVTL